MARRVLDLRVVFDHYFPGLLPAPGQIPPDFDREAVRPRLQRQLELAPDRAAIVRRFAGVGSDAELATLLGLFTHILGDLWRRGGGAPIGNEDVVYSLGPGGEDINGAVARYRTNPEAVRYLTRYYRPIGRLEVPLVSIQNLYDPIVPAAVMNEYPLMTETSGSGSLFVQRVVPHAGHCAIQPTEIDAGIAELLRLQSASASVQGGAAAVGVVH